MRKVAALLMAALLMASCSFVNRPPALSDPTPKDGARSLPHDEVVLSWDFSDPENDPVRFDVYLNGELVGEDLDRAVVVVKDLSPLEDYTWRVVARDRFDNESEATWRFSTGPDVVSDDRLDEGVLKDLLVDDSGIVGVGYAEVSGRSDEAALWINGTDGIVLPGGIESERWMGVARVSDDELVVAGCDSMRFWVEKIRVSGGVSEDWKYIRSVDYGCAYDVAVSGGFVYAVGYVSDEVLGPKEMFVVKLDLNGVVRIEKKLGYSGEIRGLYVDDPMGRVVVVGEKEGKAFMGFLETSALAMTMIDDSFGTGELREVVKVGDEYVAVGEVNGDAFLYRILATGKEVARLSFGGSKEDELLGVMEDSSGFLVYGFSESDDGDIGANFGGKDGLVARISDEGSIVWLFTIGGEDDDEFVGARTDGSNIELYGNSGGRIWKVVVKSR